MTELKEQWQRERDERRRELEAIHKGQTDILDLLKNLEKKSPETSGVEPDEHNQKHLTHLKEIWREGARASGAPKVHQSCSLMKSLFGIAPADFATGEMGSKAIHPNSLFATGESPGRGGGA
jgi:hypothetical protein